YTFAFGDVDGDGHLDVVVVSGENGDSLEPGQVTALRGDGKGAFKSGSEKSLSVPMGPHFVTLADVNNDQRLDIVTSHSSNQLSVLLNAGAGKFAPAAPYDLAAEAFALAVADVDRDKRNDIVAATVDSVTVLLGVGNGFIPAPGSPFRAGPGSYNLAIGDVNG